MRNLQILEFIRSEDNVGHSFVPQWHAVVSPRRHCAPIPQSRKRSEGWMVSSFTTDRQQESIYVSMGLIRSSRQYYCATLALAHDAYMSPATRGYSL